MTTRDNSARFAAPTPNVQPEPEEENQNAASVPGGLHFVAPTELVELPSKGLLYPEGHPLHNQEEIEIKLMTAKEEDILVNKSLLKKGVALDRMLQAIIVNKRIKLDDLLVSDKNAIIIAARVSAYGADYKASVNCPSCGLASNYEFDLEDKELKYLYEHNREDVRTAESGNFLVTLPKTNVEVEFRLLLGRDEKRLLESNKKNKGVIPLTQQFKTFIVSANGSPDRELISRFVDVMPAYDSKFLRLAYADVLPAVNLEQYFECSECDHSQEMEVPFTVEFFWPRS
tara:strand:- start:128 stop:985 length:858 start_codon:yes stop_codon:yes gene_type:complete